MFKQHVKTLHIGRIRIWLVFVDGDLDTPPELLSYDPILMTIRLNDCGIGQETDGVCQKENRWIEQSIELTAVPDEVDMN